MPRRWARKGLIRWPVSCVRSPLGNRVTLSTRSRRSTDACRSFLVSLSPTRRGTFLDRIVALGTPVPEWFSRDATNRDESVSNAATIAGKREMDASTGPRWVKIDKPDQSLVYRDCATGCTLQNLGEVRALCLVPSPTWLLFTRYHELLEVFRGCAVEKGPPLEQAEGRLAHTTAGLLQREDTAPSTVQFAGSYALPARRPLRNPG
jgi:hypothetical protein